MLNCFFGDMMCPAASWAVAEDGFPQGYGDPPNEFYGSDWTNDTPLHDDVQELLIWLDTNASGWDANLECTYP